MAQPPEPPLILDRLAAQIDGGMDRDLVEDLRGLLLHGRRSRGWTRDQLASMAHVSRKTVQRAETERVSARVYVRLVRLLELDREADAAARTALTGALVALGVGEPARRLIAAIIDADLASRRTGSDANALRLEREVRALRQRLALMTQGRTK